MTQEIHPEVTKYISERNRKAVTERWKNATKKDRKLQGKKMAEGRMRKREESKKAK